MARAVPESRQQARPLAYSLARALRALAGGLSKERLGRFALLRNASEILPNRSRKPPGTSRSSLRPSWGSFCPSWGSFGASWRSFWTSWGSLWASWGAPGALLGRSGEPLGSFLSLQKPPKSLPEALPEAPCTGA